MRHLLPVVVLAVLAGCGSSVPNAPDPIVVAHITPQYQESTSGLSEPGRLIVRDAVNCVRIWRRAFGDGAPLPAIDFSREMVIVAAMGAQPSGGFAIRVSNVTVEEGRVIVRVVNRLPGPHCATTDSPTTPVDFVLVSLLRGPVEFRDRSEVTDCGER